MTKLLRYALFVFISVSAVCAQQLERHNPVIPGDRPDPSVIRVGDDYWATTTSGSWEPGFPVFHSRDLVKWEVAGAVFENTPGWMIGDFWAPEITSYGGRFFVYYTGRRTDGRLCVAVATASTAAGPYTDHGPVVCQEVGSIDAMAVTDDATGARYLVWKADGNDRCPKCEPTIIWAQRLSKDGLKVVDKEVDLLRNEPASWEHKVVEGAFILRRGDWFYLFYSGSGCCGTTCNYALGVARSKTLLGQYKKYDRNPILAENENWQCPGHGSIVTDSKGRDFLLYHAYRKSKNGFFIGREALLDQVSWRADGWPEINQGHGPSLAGNPPAQSFFDAFDGPALNAAWGWPNSQRPSTTFDSDGWLMLSPPSDHATDPLGAVLAQPVPDDSFVATTFIDTAPLKSSVAGIAVYQHPAKAVGISVGITGETRTLSVYVRDGITQRIVYNENAGKNSRIHLRVEVTRGLNFRFAFSADGQNWKNCGDAFELSGIEAARIALTAGGQRGGAARFDWFRITPN